MKPRWILTIAAAITIGIAGVASAVAIGTRDVSDHGVAGETGAPPLSSRTTSGQDGGDSPAPSQVRNIRLAATNSSSFTIVWNAGDTDVTSLYEVSVQNGPTKRVGVERFSYPWLDATRAVITVRAVSAAGMYSAPASLTITPSSVPQNRPDDSAPKTTPTGGDGGEAGPGVSTSGSGKTSDPGDRGSRNPGRTPTSSEGDGEGSGNTGGGSGSGSRPSTPGGSGGSGSGGSSGTSPSGKPSSPLETPTPSEPSSPVSTPTHPTTAPTTAQSSGGSEKTPTDTPAPTRSTDVQSSRPTTSRATSPSSTPSQPDRYPGPTSSSPGPTGDTPTGGSTGSGSPSGESSSVPA